MEDYLLRSVGPDDCARRVAASIVSTVQALDLYEYHDDTTVVVLRLRERITVNLLIGAEKDSPRGMEAMERFFSREGERSPGEAVVVSEDRQTVRETADLLAHYLEDGMMSLHIAETQDRAADLMELLAERASDVNIILCENTEDTGTAKSLQELMRLQGLLNEAGKNVRIHVC